VLAAAEAGELKGWGPAAQRLLDGTGSGTREERAAQLRRNRRLFAANADASVVQPRGMQQLEARLQSLLPVQQPAGAAEQQQRPGWRGLLPAAQLAWQHPLQARRGRHLQQLVCEGQCQAGSGGSSSGCSRGPWQPRQVATPEGLAVDELWEQPGSRSTAVFYICPCDVAPASWERAMQVVQQAQQGGDATPSLLPLLTGGMRHHVKLVQRAGYGVRLAVPPPLRNGAMPQQ